MSENENPQVDDASEVEPVEPDSPETSDVEEFDALRAKAKISKVNAEAARLRQRLKELEPLAQKARELEDASKSESERLASDRDNYKTRAERAEVQLRKLTTAWEAAPEGATPAQINAVAKRLAGETDEELLADAEELYQLLGATQKRVSVPSRPAEQLRAGSNPEVPLEETNPRKLADLIRRGR